MIRISEHHGKKVLLAIIPSLQPSGNGNHSRWQPGTVLLISFSQLLPLTLWSPLQVSNHQVYYIEKSLLGTALSAESLMVGGCWY
jgi:hypothetical protein